MCDLTGSRVSLPGSIDAAIHCPMCKKQFETTPVEDVVRIVCTQCGQELNLYASGKIRRLVEKPATPVPAAYRYVVGLAWVAYVIAFFLPVKLVSGEPVGDMEGPGLAMFLGGILMPWWWVANPLFWWGSVAILTGRFRMAFWVNLIAVLSAASAMPIIENGVAISSGWAASAACLSRRSSRRRSRFRKNRPAEMSRPTDHVFPATRPSTTATPENPRKPAHVNKVAIPRSSSPGAGIDNAQPTAATTAIHVRTPRTVRLSFMVDSNQIPRWHEDQVHGVFRCSVAPLSRLAL